MIEIQGTALAFSFPEVHPQARMSVTFMRTLRIPDDGSDYPLPPGLGAFPVCHVDDHAARTPRDWLKHGGVMLPMHQAEAMWISFDSSWDPEREVAYPFAVKIATGKIDAVSGKPWREGLHRRPQDYVVVPKQPWIDGYCIEKGIIRQFVAMPLGAGYTAEEQLTGKAEAGGLQIQVSPMTRAAYEKRFPRAAPRRRGPMVLCECCSAPLAMGLAPGGRMKQEIYRDPYTAAEWSKDARSRCFVHICNSIQWETITGQRPPTTPPTAAEYAEAGLPWFEYFSDAAGLDGSPTLKSLKSVATLSKKNRRPLSGNESVDPLMHVVNLRVGLAPGQVREWAED